MLGAGDWCDHWKQCVWFIPGKGICVSKDEEVCLHAIHDDISISYNLKSQLSRTEIGQHDLFARDSQLILSPERVAIYGDIEWRLCMLTSIKKTVRSLSPLPISLVCVHAPYQKILMHKSNLSIFFFCNCIQWLSSRCAPDRKPYLLIKRGEGGGGVDVGKKKKGTVFSGLIFFLCWT